MQFSNCLVLVNRTQQRTLEIFSVYMKELILAAHPRSTAGIVSLLNKTKPPKLWSPELRVTSAGGSMLRRTEREKALESSSTKLRLKSCS